MANLLDNALRYNRPDGTVHIELTPTDRPTTDRPPTDLARTDLARTDRIDADRGGWAVLVVRNTGPVVPAERLDELFRPFSRLPHDRHRRDGTGLGLSIVAAIAHAHRADLAATPNPDGGLTVTVRFPTA